MLAAGVGVGKVIGDIHHHHLEAISGTATVLDLIIIIMVIIIMIIIIIIIIVIIIITIMFGPWAMANRKCTIRRVGFCTLSTR